MSDIIAPSRRVLLDAEATNSRLGHENHGFLSESFGFVPRHPPSMALPRAFQAWDEIAERFPELYRSLTLRRAVQKLPVLSATPDELSDAHLLRAASLLSILAHAHTRVERDPSGPLPECIRAPWLQVSERLGRQSPLLTYIDLIVYNWRLVDPNRNDPMRIENLLLLIPTVDNREERVFYLTQTEILAQCTPIVGAVIRAQEAVARDDPQELVRALDAITNCLYEVVRTSLPKINPVQGSERYVDPVLWAKTVAPFAVPLQEGTQGPSGTSSPIFSVLDVFFERKDYATVLGREMEQLRGWYPRHWRDFLKAVGGISVREYLDRRVDRMVTGAYREALHAYAGDDGFLGRHKLKVYGYLELAFKVGRNVTIGGFSGLLEDRAWDEVDSELEASRQEREAGLPSHCHYARLVSVQTAGADADKWVRHVILDIRGSGLRFRPGDRCGVLPENGPDLVDRTLQAMRASGTEEVRLSRSWRTAVALRAGIGQASTLPLRTFLRFAQIRPVTREIAKRLYAATYCEPVRKILDARAEDQWELWDLVEAAAAAGYDARRMWKSQVGDSDHICSIVPPLPFRLYSIASAPEQTDEGFPAELHLMVAGLRYRTEETPVTRSADRLGTASNFLGELGSSLPIGDRRIPIRIVRSARFCLPSDPGVPIVMFAGGTGLSPFRSFIQERARQGAPGKNFLFISARTPKDVYFKDELACEVANGRLQVEIALTREASKARFVDAVDGGRFDFLPGPRRRIDDLMLGEANALLLWDLIRNRSEHGAGARIYICGGTGFARTVLDGVRAVIARFTDTAGEEGRRLVEQRFNLLFSEERLVLEIFTTYEGSLVEQRPLHDASEIALRNDAAHGYWMAIRGRVYDLTEFAHTHPGGFKALRGYLGMDATKAYERVGHHASPEIDAMIGMYEIGSVRRMEFSQAWGVAVGHGSSSFGKIGPGGLRHVSLAAAFALWVRFLYRVVEMENASINDFSIQDGATAREEDPVQRSPFKTQFVLEAHERFLEQYVPAMGGTALEDLWAVTSGLCSDGLDASWMKSRLNTVLESADAVIATRQIKDLAARLKSVGDAALRTEGTLVAITGLARQLEQLDKRLLAEVKLQVRQIVRIFEALERRAILDGSQQLLSLMEGIPELFQRYYCDAGLLQTHLPPTSDENGRH